MADDDDLEEDLDDEDEDDEEEGEGGSSGSNKKLLMIIGGAIFLVVGGLAAAYFTGLLDPVLSMLGGGDEEVVEEEQQPQEVILDGEAVFYDLPELLVNLNTAGRKSTFLKIRVSLELVDPKDVPRIEALLPRIVDNFQVYLRELRIEDLKGSAGMYRLREEMMRRVAAAAQPAKINDVLFKEMIVQ